MMKMQIRVKENLEEFGRCGCGRSPTGKCCGWHGLTEEAYGVKLSEWELEQYKNKHRKHGVIVAPPKGNNERTLDREISPT
jgi:hypothetical protein